MSLFARLWIVATLTAFASAAAGVLAFAVVSAQSRAADETRTALSLARSVAFAASMDPLSQLHGEAARDLLRQRASGLMAIGQSLFVSMVGADGRAIADLAAPGLEDESMLRNFAETVASVEATRLHRVERRGPVIYVAMPLTDLAERHQGVLGLGFPVRMHEGSDDEMIAFAVAAAVIAAALGLAAAAVLTRQVAWPVRRLSDLAGRLEDADFDTSGVDALVGRGDEIGRLARVMLRLVRALDHLGRRMDAASMPPVSRD